MNIWRLIAHHEKPDEAIKMMKEKSRIAIGWTGLGDLSKSTPSSAQDINALIKASRKHQSTQSSGGPSLWNLYNEMQEGDFVIVNANGKRKCVFEVVGPYIYESGKNRIYGYSHQRDAILTDLDANKLWKDSGSAVLQGQGPRWTLVACSKSKKAKDAIYMEGERFSITSTAIERSSKAREACIGRYGHSCYICGFNFGKSFGALGEGFIHVHHKVDISTKKLVHEVDPVKDMIPLCPNCHAMAHRKKPAVPIDKLKKIYSKFNA
jgi:hypothetical protein